MSRSTFGQREATRTETIHDLCLTVMMCSRDLGEGTVTLICRRIIAQLRRGETPALGDIRTVSMAHRRYFR